MNISRTWRSTAPRLNTLAACLVLALGTGAASAGTPTNASMPLANHAPARTYTESTVAFGQHNRAHPAGSSQRAPTHGLSTATAIVPVTNCLDDNSAGSLRQVIAGAGAGDTIDMSGLLCSSITLSQGQILIAQDNLNLLGPGQGNLTIHGNNTGTVFNIFPGPNISVEDVTITDGTYQYGGCMYVPGNLTMANSTVTGCRAPSTGTFAYGGGLDVKGDLTMTNSTVSGNTASGLNSAVGGGIYVQHVANIQNSVISNNYAKAHGVYGTKNVALGGGLASIYGLTLTGSTVSNNVAVSDFGQAYGGGVHLLGVTTGTIPTGVISHSTITGNTAHSGTTWVYGGGVASGTSGLLAAPPVRLLDRLASLSVSYSTIHGNAATSDCANCVIIGGGISAFGQVALANSTVSDNRVVSAAASSGAAYGGGVATRFNQGGSAAGLITVSESTISDNKADGRIGGQGGYGRGGGVAALLSPTVIDNSTVAFNEASSSGGGVMISANSDTTSTMHSSIIANNEAIQARDIGLTGTFSNGVGIPINGNHNLVIAASANLQLPADTISADPGLRPLADNGGPTQTHALPAASLAVNAGSNPNNDACDQRGNPYGRVFGGAVDIGAYELSGVATDDIFSNGFETPCAATTPPP